MTMAAAGAIPQCEYSHTSRLQWLLVKPIVLHWRIGTIMNMKWPAKKDVSTIQIHS
jgi:hypothetical protein